MPKEKLNLQLGLANLRALIPRFGKEEPSVSPLSSSRTFYQKELGGLIFGGELSAEYEKVLQQLTPDEEIGLTRTRGETDKLLSTCVLKAVDVLEKQKGTSLEQRIDNEVASLRDQLTAQLVKWEVWRRVYGLKIPPDGFQFGQVLFCSPQHEAAREAKKAIEAKINAAEPKNAKWYRENHKEQLSYRLRLRVGQLLGRNKSGKTRLRDITKALYSVRSAIAHNGKTDIASVDLGDLRYIVEFCLEKILWHQEFTAITSDRALEMWFEDSLMNASEAAMEKPTSPT